MESQTLEVIDSHGTVHYANMRRWDEAPGNESEVLIEIAIGDTNIRGTSDRGYFHAFCEVRRQLESLGMMPRCYAACENVYPSPMIESMGCGEKAYSLTLGIQARTCDLVEVFDSSEEIRPVSVEQQKKFYESWIKSLTNGRVITKSPTPDAIAEAKANPGGWVYEVDDGYDTNGAIPPEAIVGAWKVDDGGNILGDFKPNPNYHKKKT